MSGRDAVQVRGGAEARLVADACEAAWMPLRAAGAAGQTVVVFGSFDELLTVLRARPARTVWRPVGQRLPLPRGAAWALRRVDVVVAPDVLLARSVGSVPTVVIPTAVARDHDIDDIDDIDASRAHEGLRILVVLEALDHAAGAALTVLAALAHGLVETCAACGCDAPLTFSPLTARQVAAPACPCGGELVRQPALDLRAHVVLPDADDTPWAHEYVAGLRSWFDLEERVTIAEATDATEPLPAGFDLHLCAGGGAAVPRGVYVAAAAGLPTIMAGHGTIADADAADVLGVRPCGYRTETIADDTVRVHLDLAHACRSVLDLAADADERCRLGAAARAASADHDIERLVPAWRRVLDRSTPAAAAHASNSTRPLAPLGGGR